MATPKEITELARKYIAKELVPRLPRKVEVLTLETVAWHIRLHAYQHEVLSDEDSADLEASVDALVSVLPMREGEPWQSTMGWHRVERGKALQYEGDVVYERSREF